MAESFQSVDKLKREAGTIVDGSDAKDAVQVAIEDWQACGTSVYLIQAFPAGSYTFALIYGVLYQLDKTDWQPGDK
jgi:hypothetical protein